MKPTVIVIGSADVIKLGLIRSVGELGYKVISIHIVGSSKSNMFRLKPLDYYSKYISAYYYSTADNLIDLLINKCSLRDQKPVLFPLDDKSVFLIDQSHHILNDHFLYAHVNHQEGGIIHLMNKNLQKKLAVEAGLYVAKGWEIPIVNGNYIVPKDIEYPCFVKGLFSYQSSKRCQCKCSNAHELNMFLSQSLQRGAYSLYAEEYLSVEREKGVIALSWGNNCTTPAIVDFIEEGRGSSNGVSMFGRINHLDGQDDLSRTIQRFIKSLHYTGICNIDFIESNGNLYFVEINFRYAAYGYGVFLAGVNLPALFVNNLLCVDVEGKKQLSVNGKTYFNEKVCIFNLIEKYISYEKYRELKKSADFRLIENSKDPKPYHMLWSIIVNRLLILIKSKVNRLVLKHHR